jgi:hypothetical protein
MQIRTLMIPVAMLLSTSFGTFACTSEGEPEEELFAADRCTDEGVQCQAYGRQNYQNRPPAYELGNGTTTPTLKTIYQGTAGWEPIDLEFNPRTPRELWIVNYATSHVTILTNPGSTSASMTNKQMRDPAYSHYMYKPAGIAMGARHPVYKQLWASCGDNGQGNYSHMGPSLFSADLGIFATQNYETGLGSHLDMLHSTPFCRGIAWGGQGNQYWVFNSYNKALDFYDFKNDHGPGNTDHSDGVIRRFWNNQLKGVNGVMSGVSWNPDDRKVYVADTGNKRILALDPTQGQPVAPFGGTEDIAERRYFEAPIKTVVPASAGLQQPSGLEVSGGLAFVSDAQTSKIHAFKITDGSLVRTFDTGLPSGSLAGINFGPDGKIWLVDRRASRILRIDP